MTPSLNMKIKHHEEIIAGIKEKRLRKLLKLLKDVNPSSQLEVSTNEVTPIEVISNSQHSPIREDANITPKSSYLQ